MNISDKPGYFDKSLEEIKNTIIDLMLGALSIFIIPTIISSITRYKVLGFHANMLMQILMGIVVIVTFLFRSKINHTTKIWITSGVLMLIGLGGYLTFGFVTGVGAFLITGIAISTILLGSKAGYVCIIATFVTIIVSFGGFRFGFLTFENDTNSLLHSPLMWLNQVLSFGLLAYILIKGLGLLYEYLIEMLSKTQLHNEELTAIYEELVASEEELRVNYNELEESRQAIKENEEKFINLVESSPNLIFAMDMEGKIISMNKAFEKFIGLMKTQAYGKDVSILIQEAKALEQWSECFTLARDFKCNAESRVEFSDPRGKHVVFDISMIPIFDKDNNLTAITCINHDITEIISSREEIRKLAYYDTLTGLPNRYSFLGMIAEKINSVKEQRLEFVFAYIDLDNFKKINDSMGHDIGDSILKQMGERLSTRFQEDAIVARMGGDEFAILFSGMANLEEVSAEAEGIMKIIQEPCEINLQSFDLKCSMGVVVYPRDGESVHELLKNVDTVMNLVKDSGRNNYRIFDQSMKQAVIEKVEMEAQLKNAIDRGEISVNYQPIFDIQRRKLRGVEALMRWNSPQFGMVSPEKFIPLLEESGLILKYGDWIMMEACQLNKSWQEMGYEPIVMSVNISSIQLRQKGFVKKIADVLAETGLKPQYLELEITESVMIENIKETNQILYRLKALGVKLSLDDFGTGYSSLNYLRHMPIHTLKIDKSFLTEKYKDNKDSQIIRSIMMLAHVLSLEVVAEGVETKEQMNYLHDEGCDFLQGYYLSRPVDKEEIVRILTNRDSFNERAGNIVY